MVNEISNYVFVKTRHLSDLIASSTDETFPQAINPGFGEVLREAHNT